MTELQKYLAEEVAEDLVDGIITRREAMRRLGLLGVSGAAATGLLASFATAPAPAAKRKRGRRGAETEWAAVPRESIDVCRPARQADGGLGTGREGARRRARDP